MPTGLPESLPHALIFDVDGTLYRQTPVRCRMGVALAEQLVRAPRRGIRTWRALRAYRRAQESLRHHAGSGGAHRDIAQEQLHVAAQSSGLSVDILRAEVQHWMLVAPLPAVGSARRAGLVELLDVARTRGIQLAICSDYPALAKLRALGIQQYFSVVVTAQDPEVGRFKPDPRGLQVTLERLGVQAPDAWFVADRPDVDAVAARAAGMPFVILSRRWTMAHLCREIARR